MLAIHTDKEQPDRYHLWSEPDCRYLLRSVTEQRIREHLRVNAIEEADALIDDLFDSAEVAKELH